MLLPDGTTQWDVSPAGVPFVSVEPDPTLLAADPAAMTTTATMFASGARQVYALFETSSTATAVLLDSWRGHGAGAFHDSAETTNANTQTAADALIGASNALNTLAAQIEEAQAQARAAMALAASTNDAAAGLARAYAVTRQEARAALPAHLSPEDVAAAEAPTSAQVAEADALAADGVRARQMMEAANEAARRAWKQAAAAFDAVTAQSPSVQLKLLDARVKTFGRDMTAVEVMFIGGMVAASLSGQTPSGEDGEDPPIGVEDPAEVSAALEAEGLDAGARIEVDGTELDQAVAVDGDSMIVVQAGDAEQAALGDPTTGSEIADPSAPLSADRFPYLVPPHPDDSADGVAGRLPAAEPGRVEGPVPDGWTAPGPEALDTFSGAVNPTAAIGGVTYYRVVGAGSSPDGSFWTTFPPTAQDRAGLAIKGTWNSMSGVVEFTPAEGQSIPAWSGPAAPQPVTLANGRPGYLPGGSEQIWVPKGAFNNDNGTFRIHPIDGGG